MKLEDLSNALKDTASYLDSCKEIIKKLLDCWTVLEGDEIRELEAVKEAEQFLKESE